jgi:SAM-dependent methyltransferase
MKKSVMPNKFSLRRICQKLIHRIGGHHSSTTASNKFNLQQAYETWVDRTKGALPHEAAMQRAIGGEFEAFGIIQVEILRHYGLASTGSVIDVGCGSGRTAIPLSKDHRGPYLGVDLVKDLVDHARAHCARPDWKFKVVSGLTIPAPDQSADMVCFFSVFTHLLHEQSYLYLQEARRTLKPGGRIVLSFLEFRMASHWTIFANTVEDARRADEHPLNVFIDRDALHAWAAHLGLAVVDIRDGDQPFVPLPVPVTLDSGAVMDKLGHLGQSICVLERPVE